MTVHAVPTRRRTHLLGPALLLIAATLIPARATQGAAHAYLNLTSIQFVSRTGGWATTDTAVVRTDDGGQTWQAVTPRGLALQAGMAHAGVFLDDRHAWVAAGWQGDRPDIFRTADGGRTWALARLPAPARSAGPIAVAQIDFIDPRQGWALEDLGGGVGNFYFALCRTNDGGAHWSSVAGGTVQLPPAPGAFPSNAQGIHFDPGTGGWAATVIGPGPQLSSIYHSGDAGRTWHRVALPLTGAFSAGFFGLQPPLFFDSRRGALVAASQAAVGLYVTGDGGATWAPTAPLSVKGPYAAPVSAALVDPSHAWLVAGSQLYFTADLGRHWSTIHQALGFGDIAGIDYVDAQAGWALGGTRTSQGAAHTALRRTTDGGHTWTVLHPIQA